LPSGHGQYVGMHEVEVNPLETRNGLLLFAPEIGSLG